MEDSFFVKHSRNIAVISFIGILFCIALIIIVSLVKEFSKPTYLTLQFAPSTATLSLDEPAINLTNGSYEFDPGNYTGILTADGFEPKHVTVTVSARQVNTYTDYLVKPTTGLNSFEQNAADISTLRNLTDHPDITQFLESYDHKASLYDQLPLSISWLKRPDDTPTYTLTVTSGINHPNCTGTLCLMTTGPSYNPDELSQALSKRGYDINDYEVFYEYSAL